MDDLRVGGLCRALRRQRGWRQIDLATRAGCDQTTISLIERGFCAGLRLALVRRVFEAMGASFDGLVRWRAGDLDRLVDRRHARIIEVVARVVGDLGWDVVPEMTYSEYGERGSIDVFASSGTRLAIAIFEIKTEVVAIGETIRKHDEKTRLAAEKLAFRRLGWNPRLVGRFLVLAEDATARRRVAAHRATFHAAYPLASREVRSWLREPASNAGGVWFLSVSSGSPDRQGIGGPKRVRLVRTRPTAHDAGATTPLDRRERPAKPLVARGLSGE